MTSRLPAILAAAVLTGSLISCSAAPPVLKDHTLTQTLENPVAQGILAPGDPIVVKNGNDEYGHCTAGVVVESQGMQGILTAGHCGSAGDPVFIQGRDGRWVPVSKVARSVFNPATGIDSAFIPLPGGQADQHVRSVSVTSSGVARGTKLCAAGATSGYRCGSVLTVGKTRIVADFPSAHGDSGGPVWAGDRIVGIAVAIAAEDSDKTVVFPIGAAMRAVGASLTS